MEGGCGRCWTSFTKIGDVMIGAKAIAIALCLTVTPIASAKMYCLTRDTPTGGQEVMRVESMAIADWSVAKILIHRELNKSSLCSDSKKPCHVSRWTMITMSSERTGVLANIDSSVPGRPDERVLFEAGTENRFLVAEGETSDMFLLFRGKRECVFDNISYPMTECNTFTFEIFPDSDGDWRDLKPNGNEPKVEWEEIQDSADCEEDEAQPGGGGGHDPPPPGLKSHDPA